MDKRQIGKRLKLCRGNTPRRQVAESCGIALSTLQSYEDGFRIPKDDIKVKLATYYGVSVGKLFFNE